MNDASRFFEPEGWQEGFFKAEHGRKIHYGHARPAGQPEGTVIITTGYADFIEPYFETIHAYLERGYAVWMMEWPGHGQSTRAAQGRPAILDDFVSALHQFRTAVVAPEPDRPVIFSTHSMGGQVGLRSLGAYPDDYHAAILATPMVDTKATGEEKERLKKAFFEAEAQGLGDRPVDDGRRKVTRQIIAERKAHSPENPVRTRLHRCFLLLDEDRRADDPSIGMMASIFRSAAMVNDAAFLQKIATPVLIVTGSEDKLVNAPAIARAAGLLPDARHVDIAGAGHGIWLERDRHRDILWAEIDGFLARAQNDFKAGHVSNPGAARAPLQPEGPKGP